MKIVINKCYGGFGLSHVALKLAIERGLPVESFPYDSAHSLNRDNVVVSDLGEGWVVMGRSANSSFATLVKDGMAYYESGCRDHRSHPALIYVVEELGGAADGECAQLKVVEIPDGTKFEIQEYDGQEWIAESHQTWA